MGDQLIIASLLNFSAASAAIIQRAGYHNISRMSQVLAIPLIFGGTLAGLLAIYVFVASEGILGLLYWAMSSIGALGLGQLVRASWDGILSILGVACLVTGGWMFAAQFI